MQCPKCRDVDLVDHVLGGELSSYHCEKCEGDWLSGDRYQTWQNSQHKPKQINTQLTLAETVIPGPTDNKAALCPECRRYLSRVKVPVDQPFYLERCPGCNGFWCDRQEWDILQKLQLHTSLEYLFTAEWQHKIREQQHSISERQALIQKLGEQLATEVFHLGDKLTAHENGDFAVAYLARQVAENQDNLPQ
ncbi:zf-TFIIB domain-containing protein [Picosynechococcus sp. NKBG15041c]|uniref:zf-TFIIB domain-containing protein n=1 Tax=Picosynechococcus sp. NKBG15041c TaxID=1407650 RepID=UPI000408A66B|nr:zf-TFIIB domain-containing protein [Picosynechococcus sp. NKBG15041c]